MLFSYRGALRVGLVYLLVSVLWIGLTQRLLIEFLDNPMTDLPNRLLFTDRAEQALASSQIHKRGCALLLLDLDHFKIINDSLGLTSAPTLRSAQDFISTLKHKKPPQPHAAPENSFWLYKHS